MKKADSMFDSLLKEMRGIVKEELRAAIPSKASETGKITRSTLVSRNHLIQELMISATTYYRWVEQGVLPEPRRIAGRVYFTREQVEELKSNFSSLRP